MKKHRLYGVHKTLFLLEVKISVVIYFLRRYLRDRDARKLVLTLLRLNTFIGKLTHGKFARIGENIRLDMYVPGFPSRAFYTACEKFAVFGEKLPSAVALISVTSACTYRCEHCYQRLDTGKDVDLDKLIEAVKYLQDSGIAFFNIEGGEPFITFDRLLALSKAIDDRSEIWINTTGYGVTRERLEQLKGTSVTTLMFSLHSHDEATLNSFMGNDNAWQTMIRAIELCHELGIAVAFNACIPLRDFRNGNFELLMERARDLGAILIQIIKPKPSGAWLEKGVEQYGPRDFRLIKRNVQRYNLDRQFVDYPAISAQIIEEDPEMFGCTAGGTDRVYLNAKGDVQPCEFLNISFGNITEEDFSVIYQRMRAAFAIPQTCISCEKYAGEIYRLFKESNLKQLPLPKELTEQICRSMTRNSPTKLYHRIEHELR